MFMFAIIYSNSCLHDKFNDLILVLNISTFHRKLVDQNEVSDILDYHLA